MISLSDDPQAFLFSQMQDVESNAALFDEVKENYLKLAEELEYRLGQKILDSCQWIGFLPT